MRRVLAVKLGGNAHAAQKVFFVALDDEALGERCIASVQDGQDCGGDQLGALHCLVDPLTGQGIECDGGIAHPPRAKRRLLGATAPVEPKSGMGRASARLTRGRGAVQGLGQPRNLARGGGNPPVRPASTGPRDDLHPELIIPLDPPAPAKIRRLDPGPDDAARVAPESLADGQQQRSTARRATAPARLDEHGCGQQIAATRDHPPFFARPCHAGHRSHPHLGASRNGTLAQRRRQSGAFHQPLPSLDGAVGPSSSPRERPRQQVSAVLDALLGQQQAAPIGYAFPTRTRCHSNQGDADARCSEPPRDGAARGPRTQDDDLVRHAWAASERSSSARKRSRIRYFWTLPLTVSGKPSTKRTWRGTL